MILPTHADALPSQLSRQPQEGLLEIVIALG
jgi:hypothetical protein